MADGLGVLDPRLAGLLVSAYALGVMLGAPLMTLTTARMNRRTLLIGLMAIFTLRQFPVGDRERLFDLMVARVITSPEPRRLLRRRIGHRGAPRSASSARARSRRCSWG